MSLARFVCIFSVCFVHLYGQEHVGALGLDVVSTLVIDVMGRASVPLLSAVSGYLAIVTLGDQAWRAVIGRKFVSLIVPMATWNFLALLFAFGVYAVADVQTALLDRVDGKSGTELLFSSIFAVDHGSIQESHNFLRDVFACFLLLPLLFHLIRLGGLLAALAICAFALALDMAPIVYRESILLFFVAGVALAMGKLRIADVVSLWPISLGCFLVVLTAELASGAKDLLEPLLGDYNLFKRLVVSHFLISLCYFLSGTLPKRTIGLLGRLAFPAFLAHNIVFAVLWAPVYLAIDAGHVWTYGIYFAAAPMLLWLAAFLLHAVIAQLPGVLQILLSGKSGKTPSRQNSVASSAAR